MAGSVNKVILIGNLGSEPDVRNFPNGGKVCNLSIATSENWKDKSTGERREKTEWHRVAIFSEPLVRVAEQFLKKRVKSLPRRPARNAKVARSVGHRSLFHGSCITSLSLRTYYA